MKRLVPRFASALAVSLPSPWPTPSLRRDRPSASALQEPKANEDHPPRKAVEPSKRLPGRIVWARDSCEHDQEDQTQAVGNEAPADSFDLVSHGRTLRPWQRPSKTDDACSAPLT